MPGKYPECLCARPSFVLGKLHLRSLELEGGALARLGVDVKQHAVLAVLAEEGPMTQQELGQRLGIDRTTIVSVVDGLEEGELVERRRSPHDRRAYLLTLTTAGRRTGRRGQRLVDTARDRLLAGLDDVERRTLVDLLARVL